MTIGNIRDKLDGDELDLSMMGLKEVPLREIVSVPRATVLDLSSNLLKNLPPSFGAQVSHIVKLDLSANKLQSLPRTFHLLINLKHLDLYSNQLTDLPPSLHHLVKLKFLDIKNNPLKPHIKAVVGDCVTKRECEIAARQLIHHYNKEKQLAIEQVKGPTEQVKGPTEPVKMANKNKSEEHRREEADAVRNRNEKKNANNASNKKNANNKSVKQQHHDSHQKSSNGKASVNKMQRGVLTKDKKSRGWCSCLGLLNMLMLTTVLTATVWCLHVHLDGDYSQAGLKAAVPRFQKNVLNLRNATYEAMKPENLQQTKQIVFKNANATAYQVAGTVQRAAYASQAYVEVYTGDLTPYTSKVSQASWVAYQWTSAKVAIAYQWLLAQDWQGMYDTTSAFVIMVWKKIQVAWASFISHPTVASAWTSVCAFCSTAAANLQEILLHVFQYLQKNVPIWLEIVQEKTYTAAASVKNSVQSLLK